MILRIALASFILLASNAFGASIPGTLRVTAPIAPSDDADTYPTHDARWGRGGYRSVTDVAARDAIPASRRDAGMLVWVESDQRLFRLGSTLTNWTEAGDVVRAQNRTELIALGANQLAPNAVIHMLGYSSPGDGGDGAFYYAVGSSSTNLPNAPASGGALIRLGDWGGNVRIFGLRTDYSAGANANTIALQLAAEYAATEGRALHLPGGEIYVDGSLNASNLNAVRGTGVIGPGRETTIMMTRTNTSWITNAQTGFTLSDMRIRAALYVYGKLSTNGWAVEGASGASVQRFERLYIEGFFGGIAAKGFDIKFSDVNVIANRPFLVTEGTTQNTFDGCKARGNLFATGLDDNVSITGAYTAGATNLVVSDASAIAVGDYLRVRDSIEFPNAIAYRFFPRKVVGVAGNVVTISHPWDLSFSGGRFDFVLGAGHSAFEANTENVFIGCNAEWGAWRHIFTTSSGPTASLSIKGMHVEGWVADPGSGQESFVVNALNTSTSGSYVDMANCVLLSGSVSFWEPGSRGAIDVLHVRDFEALNSDESFWLARTLTKSYSGSAIIRELNNAGARVNQHTIDGNQWRNVVVDLKLGEGGEIVRVDGIGPGIATFYGYGAMPTSGNYLRGDSLLTTADEEIRCLESGSFQTPAGSNMVFGGSSVLLVDADARSVLGRRTPVMVTVTNGLIVTTNHLVVREQLRNAPDVSLLAAPVASGSRFLHLASASGVQQGDPFVVAEGSTYSDGVVARVVGNYVWSTFAVTNTFTTNATFRTGVQLFGVSASAVHWQPLRFAPPVLSIERDYLGRRRVGGPSVGTALTIQGGGGGVPGLTFERPGAGTNEVLWSGDQFRIRDAADAAYLLSATKGATDTFLTGGNSSGASSPRALVVQAEGAIGTNISGATTTIRAGLGTGNASPAAVMIRAPVPVAAGSAVQTYETAMRWVFPPTPDASLSNSPLQSVRWDGSNWITMSLVWTNRGGLWETYWR